MADYDSFMDIPRGGSSGYAPDEPSGGGIFGNIPGGGFLISGLIQLAGGILGGLTRRDPPLSPQEKYFQSMVNFYADLGKKHKAAASTYTAFTGKPAPASLQFDFGKSWDKYGTTGVSAPAANTAATRTTYEGD